MNCKDCKSAMSDLLLDGGSAKAMAAKAHTYACTECARELAELEETLRLMDAWEAPAISPYFDQKMAVKLREAQESAPESWWERMRTRLLYNTNHQLRPAMAGGLALVLAIGGGTFGVVNMLNQPVEDSHVVRDLKDLDQNEKVLQQVDQLLQQGTNEAQPAAVPES